MPRGYMFRGCGRDRDQRITSTRLQPGLRMFTRLMTRGSDGRRTPERRTAIRLVWGMGALFLAMVASVSGWFVSERWRVYRDTEAEVSSLPAATAIVALASATAAHRGTTAGMLAGSAEFRDRQWRAGVEMEQRLATVLVLSGPWHTRQIRALRDHLAREVPSLQRA